MLLLHTNSIFTENGLALIKDVIIAIPSLNSCEIKVIVQQIKINKAVAPYGMSTKLFKAFSWLPKRSSLFQTILRPDQKNGAIAICIDYRSIGFPLIIATL